MIKKIVTFIRKQKTKLAVVFTSILGIGNPITVFAAKTDKNAAVTEVTDGINVLETIVLTCVGGVGVIFLAWGIMDFGSAYSAHDTTQQSMAIKKVIGGLIMVAVPVILKALGIS